MMNTRAKLIGSVLIALLSTQLLSSNLSAGSTTLGEKTPARQHTHPRSELIYYKMWGLDEKNETILADIVAYPNGHLSGVLWQGFQVHDVRGNWDGFGMAVVYTENTPTQMFMLEVVDTYQGADHVQ